MATLSPEDAFWQGIGAVQPEATGQTYTPGQALFGGVQAAQNVVAPQQVYENGGYQAPLPQPPAPIASNPANDRYGTDLSWLDPSFQVNPAMLGQSAGSQVYANPADVAAQQQALSGYQGLEGAAMNFASPAQQQSALNQYQGYVGNQMNFASPAQQQQALNQYAGYVGKAIPFESDAKEQGVFDAFGARAAGQGAPQFMGNTAQQGIVNDIGNLKDPSFLSDADQRGVMNSLGSIAQSGGKQGITFDDGSRQAEQYGNLDDIINRGGLTANQVAARQGQRADEEQWLRSQREADQQSAAARGMSGSGSELLSLGADRQASAGRNSLADLQTAAQAETNRLSAIGQAGDLAGTMRGQTAAEQEYAASRGDNALVAQGTMANQLRGDQAQEQEYLATQGLNKLATQGSITGQMRSQDDTEKTYNDQRIADALAQQSALSQAMRGQTATEQLGQRNSDLTALGGQADMANQLRANQATESIAQRNSDLTALGGVADMSNSLRTDQMNESNMQRTSDLNALAGAGNLSTNMRNASSQEGQYRATSADNFATLNQSAYNSAQQNNAAFLQNSYQSMMNNRQNWQMNNLNQGVGVATGLQNFDANENQTGYGQGTALAGNDANAFNQAQTNRNAALMGANGQTSAQVLNANYAQNQAGYAPIGTIGSMADSFATAAYGGMGSAGGGTASGVPAGNFSTLTAANPYGTGDAAGAPKTNGGQPFGAIQGTTQSLSTYNPNIIDPKKKVY